MCAPGKRISIIFIVSLCIFLSAPPLYADDTEVFFNDGATTGINPNVLFVVDTSGSMGSTLSITPDYDPATIYPGTCSSTRLYWNPNGGVPACTTRYYIEKSAFKCISGLNTSTNPNTGPLYEVGFYSDIFSRYNDGNIATAYWTTLTRNKSTQYVECKEDDGVHGDYSGGTYAADKINGGPWKATSTNSINWNDSGTAQAYRIYSGNYLNYLDSGTATVTKTRLNVVHGVITNLINSTRGINAGLMRFDDKSRSLNRGGYVALPMQEVLASSHKTFNTELSSWDAAGWTPLAETMYEAMLFFKGDPLFFGDETTPEVSIASSRDPSDPTRYQSPIEFQCQKNFVIYLTDGEPTYDDSADTEINALAGFKSLTGGCGYSANDCLDEMAQYMYEKDLRSDLNDKQNVITYTIGFGTTSAADALLEDTARKGGSTGGQNGVGFFKVNNRNEMSSTFAKIITQILELNTTFTAPAVSVNAFNRLTHRGELYFALFRPDDQPRWHGNLKRYQLVRSDPDDITSPTVIVDYYGKSAVDQNTGFFVDTAQSWWLDGNGQADGKEVDKGGAAHQLQLDRTIYTYTGVSEPVNIALNTADKKHRLHEDNDSSVNGQLNNTLLGLNASTTDSERIALIQWARGLDIDDEDSDNITTTEARHYIGDPLHSKPALMTYKGTNEEDADITLFMATNEGYLHAFDLYNPTPGDPSDDTVTEHFAFIPQELLPNLNGLKTNAAVNPHIYGLDGPISLWHKDLPDVHGKKDGLVLNANGSVQTGEHVYLYMGMRRGGNNYYAMDVTNRNNPVLKWIIKGGVTPGFEELAQTWSTARHIKIMWQGTEKDALVFAGGYDTAQDSGVAGRPSNDSVGRAVYIVDAENGSLLWWAGPDETTNNANLKLADMKNSIAADVVPIDHNNNGYVDRLYTADLGGRIWRFDIDEKHTTADNFATGGVLADLGGTTAKDNRRFYYSPSVAWNQKGSVFYYSIAIGSGYRAHPLDKTVLDRFYVVRDTNEKDANGNITYTAITETDLYDATNDIVNTGTDAEKLTALDAIAKAEGWYIDLVNPTDGSLEGEKVLAPAVTFRGTVMFTTYTPVPDTQTTGCAPNTGTSKFYLVDLYNAAAIVNFDTNNGYDRSSYVAGGSIPAPPTVIYDPDGGGITITVGPNKIDFGTNDPFSGRMFSVERWQQTR